MHCASDSTRGHTSIIIEEGIVYSLVYACHKSWLSVYYASVGIFLFRATIWSLIPESGNTYPPNTTVVDDRMSYANVGTETAPALLTQLAQCGNIPYHLCFAQTSERHPNSPKYKLISLAILLSLNFRNQYCAMRTSNI